MKRSFDLPWAITLSVLLIGLAWAYLVASETPRGRVTGVAVRQDANGKPIAKCRIYLSPVDEEDEGTASRRGGIRQRVSDREQQEAVTDKQGRFTLTGVPIGRYRLSARSKRHEGDATGIEVAEAQTVTENLVLTRSQPDLRVGDHQADFGTEEKPFLPVRGYVPEISGEKESEDENPVLRVRLWRTRLSQILQDEARADALEKMGRTWGDPVTVMPPALLKPDGGSVKPALVADTVVPITKADSEGFFVERVPLTAAQAKPGAYLAEFRCGKKTICSYVLISDLALVAKRGAGSVVCYAAHLKTGTPASGASVALYRQSQRVVGGKASENGVAEFTLPKNYRGESGDNGTLAVATLGDDEAVVRRVGSYGAEGNGAEKFVSHTLTDRTIYRPGDTIEYKTIVRQVRQDSAGYDIPRRLPATIEVRDPTGLLVAKETKTTNDAGAYWGNFTVSSEGATGNYSIVADMGGEKQTAEVPIAAYRKPEFTVTVTPDKPRCVRGEIVPMNVAATYYFGSPVAGAKAHYTIYRDADWATEYAAAREASEGDDDSEQDESYRNYYGETVAEGDVILDSAGKAVIRVDTGRRHTDEWFKEQAERDSSDKAAEDDVPQAEQYRVSVSIEEAAGRSVQGDASISVRAAEVVVSVAPEGYVAEPGKPAGVYATARGIDGKPAVGTVVTLTAAYSKWDAKTKKDSSEPLGAAQTATTGADGRAYFSVTPPKGGEVKLTASVRDAAGREAKSEGNLWAASDSGADLDTNYSDLTVLTDKKTYEPGETARVLLNTFRTGQTALICIEGEKIYQAWTIPITKESSVFRVPIKAEWGGNVTLTACYIKDKHFASADASLRIKLKARELAVSVTPVGGDRYGPGQNVTYAVETKDAATGKPTPAALSLAVADESLFALQADDPKALKDTFYPRRTNQVNTSYSFSVDYLGGADKEGPPNIAVRRRFKDTAGWFPDVNTDANGKATVTVTLPDNLTTWRATVNAVSDRTAVGYAASKIVTSKPFFVRLETPRFLTGGDASRLRALIHNETGKSQSVTVRLDAANLPLSDGSAATQTMTVANGAVQTIDWPITAPVNASGPTPIRVSAWTGADGGQQPVTDGVEQSLPLRAYGKTEFTTFAADVRRDAESPDRPADAVPLTATPDRLTLVVDKNAVPVETRLTVRLTPSVRGALTGGVEYLIGFPYGCTEQTLSRFYPDLLAKRANIPLSATQTAELPRMTRDGIARLATLQHESGGWGWWESDKDDPFLTAYALVGVGEAHSQGMNVGEMLTKGQKAAEAMIDKSAPHDRPFLLYALASSGSDTARLKNAFRYSVVRTGLEPKKLPPTALAYMVLLGQKTGEDYRPFWDELQRRAVVQGRVIHWNGAAKGDYDAHTSDRMATALGLRCLLALDPKDARVSSILRYLMQSRTDGWFGDTRDTSWVLAAFCDYLKAFPDDGSTGGKAAIRLNGRTIKTISLDTKEPEIVLSLPATDLRPGPNEMIITRTEGKGVLFYSGALRQTIAAPGGQALAASPGENIAIERKFLRINPKRDPKNPWNVLTEPVRDGRFTQGEPLRVRLIVTAKKAADYILIEDTFPSGAEVTERGSAETDSSDSRTLWYDHADVRDDRIAFFISHLEPGVHTLEYNLRAQTPGKCRALPAQIQAMYDAAVRASSDGAEIEVVK